MEFVRLMTNGGEPGMANVIRTGGALVAASIRAWGSDPGPAAAVVFTTSVAPADRNARRTARISRDWKNRRGQFPIIGKRRRIRRHETFAFMRHTVRAPYFSGVYHFRRRPGDAGGGMRVRLRRNTVSAATAAAYPFRPGYGCAATG